MGNFLRQLNQEHGNSPTLDLQLWSLHESKLGPLHMGHSCLVGFLCGAPGSGTRIYPWYIIGFFEPITVLY